MAAIVPDDAFDRRRAAHGAYGAGVALELVTLEALAAGPPDELTVHHSVHWTRFGSDGRTRFGEIDFVVAAPDGRLLVIEQKNGPLVERDDSIVKEYWDTGEDVVPKVMRSLHALRERYFQANGEPLQVDALLYLPDHRLVGPGTAQLGRERIVDVSRRSELANIVRALLPAAPATEHGRRVHRFLAGELRATPSLRGERVGADALAERLLGEAAEFAGRIGMDPLRLRIRGPAGSGKTRAGLSLFRSAVEAGRRAAFLCFNRPLADWLRGPQTSGGVVDTVDGLFARALRLAGGPAAPADGRYDGGWFQEVRDALLMSGVPDGMRFDLLVLDEAQDIDDDRWQTLMLLFLEEGGGVVVLDDPAQQVHAAEPFADGGFVTLRLDAGCRTPASIAAFLARAVPEIPFRTVLPHPGLGVRVRVAGDRDGILAEAQAAIRENLARGFGAAEIVLLSLRGRGSSVLSGLGLVGPYRLRFATKEHRQDGSEVMSAGDFHWETVRRFKGREAPVVILLDVDDLAGKEPELLRLVHTGLTRATLRAEIVVQDGSAIARRLVEAAGHGDVPTAAGGGDGC